MMHKPSARGQQGRANLFRALVSACSITALAMGGSFQVRAQETETPASAPQQPLPDEDTPNILVIGDRMIIASLQDVPVEAEYDEDDVASYAVSTVGELLDAIRDENGDEDPAILVNGRPVSSPDEIADLPAEAVARIEALPRGAAQRIGGAAGQRAYNIVLRPSVKSATVTGSHQIATEGGWSNTRGEVLLTYVRGQDRINLTIRGAESSNLFESERDFIPRTEGTPFSPIGNIVPASGAEVDPALSALAGQPVFVVALPEGNANPTLANLVAGANQTNPSEQSFYRTLRGANRPYDVALTGHKTLAPWLSMSFNGRLNWTKGKTFAGLPTGRFLIPAAHPDTPFTVPVALALSDPSRPLIGISDSTNRSVATTFNATLGEWRATVVGRWDERERTYTSEFSGPLNGGTNVVDAAVNPFAGSLAALIPVNTRESRSKTSNTQITADAEGPLFDLWTGPIWARVGVGAGWVDLDAVSFSGPGSFERHEYSAKAGVTIPLTGGMGEFLQEVGDTELALDIGHVDLGRFGTLHRHSIAFNWQMVNWLRLVASLRRDEQPIIPELLAAPETIVPNVPYFDPLTGDTVDVTVVYGGAGNLQSEDTRTRTLSLTATPLPKYRLRLNIDYLFTDVRNQIGALPPPSAAVVAAFPDRFQRDASGTLVLVDNRSINFARERSEQVRFGLGFTIPLSETVLVPADAETRAPRRRIPPLNLQVNASHTVLLQNTTTIRDGLPEIDLLEGGAIGLGGGRQRHASDVNLALTKGGSGLRLSARRRGASYLVIGTREAPNLLTFEPLTTVNLRAFADLDQLFPSIALTEGVRLTVSVDNLTNERQRVTDRAGSVPQAYQPVRRDPIGRMVMFELRKTF